MAAVPAWYHTIDLGDDVITPGHFDLRPVIELLPWPDVEGKRCLDIGSYDGFYAFELERRGAAEVVAVDVSDPHQWDWPADSRETGPARALEAVEGRHAAGFEVAREALGSTVAKEAMTVYELDPERLGEFDVVVCGSLLLHLRDPLRALEAIRTVCRGELLSVDEIRLLLSLVARRRPLAEIDGGAELMQWMVPNAQGHRRMLTAAGFQVRRHTRPFPVPFGPAHREGGRSFWSGGPRRVATRVVQRLVMGGVGVPHAAVLAAPRE